MTRRLMTRMWTALCMSMAATTRCAKAGLGVLALVAMMTGCSDDDLASNANANGVNPTDMNVDEMKVTVTADVPTAVLSSFDENSMGGALARRLSKTTSGITDETKMILIKGEDSANRPLSEWLEAAKIYLRGGYIAVEKPINAHLVKVMEQLADKMTQAEEEMMLKDGISIVRTARSKTAAQSSHISRLNTRIANITTRAGESVSDNEPVAELVIFANNGYYHCAPMGTINIVSSTRDKSGNVTTKEEKITREYTPYDTGLQADGAAQWLNDRGEAQQVRSAGTRADGNDAINDLMSADEEYTYQSDLVAFIMRKVGRNYSRTNAFTEKIRSWGVHNIETNKDYYFIDQKIVASVGGKDGNNTLYVGPYEANEYNQFNGCFDIGGKTYNLMYGAWYGGGDYSMNLNGSGSVQLEDARPSSDNNEGSKTITVGQYDATTTTIGFSATPSFSMEKGAGFSATGSFSRGYTEGNIFVMGSTVKYNELTCQKNTDGTKVRWTYGFGPDILAGDDNDHPLAPDALVGDVDINNQACWSVGNPEGHYTLNIDQETKMCTLCACKYDLSDKGPKAYWYTSCAADPLSYILFVPNRSQQKWNMDVTFPELNQDGYDKVKPQLTAALQNQFPSIYQPELVLADQTDASENTIRQIVSASNNLLMDANALQTLREYAKTYKISEFTIKWYCAGSEHNTYQFTVKAEGDPVGVDKTIAPTDLSTLKADFIAIDGDILTGTLAGNYKISIANGSTITLNGVTINNTDDKEYDWAGITCQGDATIVLADGSTNVVKGFNAWQPSIFVPSGKKLVIQGNTGTLDATNKGQGPGIGGNNSYNCGSIEIQGGVITAKGGDNGAGIGGALKRGCGDIVISGGTVTATGGYGAAGIGSGRSKDNIVASCGNITISGGTVVANHGDKGAAIGTGDKSKCGNITITKGVKSVTATGEIGAGRDGKCGTVTIEEGANVIKQ